MSCSLFTSEMLRLFLYLSCPSSFFNWSIDLFWFAICSCHMFFPGDSCYGYCSIVSAFWTYEIFLILKLFLNCIGRYRRKRDRLVELAAAAPIPTMWGPFTAHCYRSLLDGIEHIAMVKVCIYLNCQALLVKFSYFCI